MQLFKSDYKCVKCSHQFNRAPSQNLRPGDPLPPQAQLCIKCNSSEIQCNKCGRLNTISITGCHFCIFKYNLESELRGELQESRLKLEQQKQDELDEKFPLAKYPIADRSFMPNNEIRWEEFWNIYNKSYPV